MGRALPPKVPFYPLLVLVITLTAGAAAQQQPADPPAHWFWNSFEYAKANATTFTHHDDYVVISNLFFHFNRFFAVAPAAAASSPDHKSHDLAKHFRIAALPTTNVPSFIANLHAGWVPGTTLVLPFPLPKHASHAGFWAELLTPVYSALAAAGAAAAEENRCVRTVLVPNLKRRAVMASPWVEQVLQAAVQPGHCGTAGSGTAPQILFWEDLERVPERLWLAFERVLHVYSRHNHPRAAEGRGQGFTSPEHAHSFRQTILQAAGFPAPPPGVPVPRTITYLMPTDSGAVANNKEVLAVLRAAAAKVPGVTVRPYSPSPAAPFASLVAVMARTGVLVARHDPVLASSLLLPPGAAIVEILPHNWNFQGIHEVYVNLTWSTGVLGHVAWRAPSGDAMSYVDADDARYAHWTPEECRTADCLDAQSRAAVRVNGTELQALVEDALLSVVTAKAGMAAALRNRWPWPPRSVRTGTTGLWWDK